MIVYQNRDIIGFMFNGKAIAEIRKGTRLVWEAITSCLGSGRWINERMWKNTDGWKN